ncbi:MAG: DUF1501 domain-containing protein [Deltaproteobacteria bacterium]|nr:DUF1501 domain-containing protein [Deltaproteobacteria bacterium]
MNRREFAFKGLAGFMLAGLPNAVFLSADDGGSGERSVVINIIARGGYDGMNVVVPYSSSEAVDFAYRVRPTIYGRALPRSRPSNNAWWFENLIPIGNEASSDHPGVRLHPLFSRLFDIAGNRIISPRISVNGESVPLSRYLALKAVWACGPMFAVNPSTGSFSPPKSHEVAQRIVTAGNSDPGQSNGYSARFYDRVIQNPTLFGCIGVGGVSPIELGISQQFGNRLTLPTNFQLSFRSHEGYDFDKNGCRDYQATRGRVSAGQFSQQVLKALFEYVGYTDTLNPWRNRFLAMFTNTRNMLDISARLNQVQIDTQVDNQSLFDGQFIDFQGAVQTANLYSGLGQAITRFALYEGSELGNVRYALVSIGGNFDSHREQVEGTSSIYPSFASIAGMITGVMYNVVKARLSGKLIKVIIVLKTEFGRTVFENGSSGTDHGSGNCFVAVANTDAHDGSKHKIIGPKPVVGQRGVEDFRNPTTVNLNYSPFDLAPKHGTLALHAAILRKYIKRNDLVQEIMPELKYMEPLNEQRYFADNLLSDL